ncbi:MAG TPA: zf-HC2 domain-containing protein [Armatimonadota bacterium]|nr:zf-HC2 domain-containing protein [Armatimonadota bacterium]
MSCKRMARRIQAYLDGAANAAERLAMETHAAGCPECARELEQYRRLAAMLGGRPERRVSDGFEARLQAALRETAPAPAASAWWERFRLRTEWRLRMPAMVAAATVACAVAAAVVTPAAVRERERHETRSRYVAYAVEKHRELQNADSRADWDAVDSSIELSTGSVLTE